MAPAPIGHFSAEARQSGFWNRHAESLPRATKSSRPAASSTTGPGSSSASSSAREIEMNVEEMIAKLAQTHRLLRELREGADIRQIQSILGHADHNLHWAPWNLGEVETLRPEVAAE